MIGIDTSIRLRLWLNDDPAQTRRIDALLAAHGRTPGPLRVKDRVLAEAVCTLQPAFDQHKAAQRMAVRSLLDETAFGFEDREALIQAAGMIERGSCGFSDGLIVAKHARMVCAFTATFDRVMRKLPGAKGL